MIDREEAIDLIETLAGDEHSWVDAKDDYYVLGLENKKADFVKDVAAMANTLTERNSHYIFVGVEDDTGDLVGVSDGFDDESGPHHILSVDEADLQQVLTEYVSPTPIVDFYTFTGKEPIFGVLSIEQTKKKPCTIQKSIDFQGERKLQEGLIYFRSGSSNTIAIRADVERMIDERIQNRRDEILEGIRVATEIGPEAVATVGEIVHEDEGDMVVEVGDEGDFVMEERFSREPISDIDERLTLDMKRWATTDTVNIDNSTLWEYYSLSDQISIDEQSILFLTKASLDVGTYGGFWLTYVDENGVREILLSSTDGLHRNEDIGKILVALGDCEGLENLYENMSSNENYDPFPRYYELCDQEANQRLDSILSKSSYDIGYRDWSKSMDLISMEESQLRDTIQELAVQLQDLESRYTGLDKWYQIREDFREALKDAELSLLAHSSE